MALENYAHAPVFERAAQLRQSGKELRQSINETMATALDIRERADATLHRALAVQAAVQQHLKEAAMFAPRPAPAALPRYLPSSET